MKGRARLVLEVTQLNTTDGQRVRVQTSPFERQAESSARKDAARVGIGVAVGGAAGAGQVLLTRGQAAELDVETRLSLRLQEPVRLTEKRND